MHPKKSSVASQKGFSNFRKILLMSPQPARAKAPRFHVGSSGLNSSPSTSLRTTQRDLYLLYWYAKGRRARRCVPGRLPREVEGEQEALLVRKDQRNLCLLTLSQTTQRDKDSSETSLEEESCKRGVFAVRSLRAVFVSEQSLYSAKRSLCSS